MELIKQGDELQFQNETKLFHFEFSNICNQHCSYCVEGNFNLEKPKLAYSKKEDLLGTLDKIFEAYPENIMLGFILVGGEPTLQPHLKDVVEKIKSRKNAFQVLTTNFTQSVDYYRELDIPLVTSLHFDSQNSQAWLEKTLMLKDLVAHTRIMAHPQKMDKVKEAYNLFMEASKTAPLSFAVEEITDFSINTDDLSLDYKANYSSADLEFVRSCKPVDAVLPKSLTEKLGILQNSFYRSKWIYSDCGKETLRIEDRDENRFKNFFCERSMFIIRPDGHLFYGWACADSNKNIFELKKFPKNDVQTVICHKENCPLSIARTIPKYKAVKYAPDYVNKNRLRCLRLKSFFFIDRLNGCVFKKILSFVVSKEKRSKFIKKHIKN